MTVTLVVVGALVLAAVFVVGYFVGVKNPGEAAVVKALAVKGEADVAALVAKAKALKAKL